MLRAVVWLTLTFFFVQTLYDEVEIEDMEWNSTLGAFTYQCPCGDLFQITPQELRDGEDIAHCPSCTLVVRVIYDPDDYQNDQLAFKIPRAIIPREH